MGLKDYTDETMAELKYKDITEKIIGASFEVHKFLGNRFQEVIYQRALAWELSQAGLAFVREIEQDIFYKELHEPIGTRRADFVVEGKVLLELKAIIELEDVHLAQVLNYLKAYKLEVGLLINFGSKSLTFKRLVL
jgi:GxxExxY protein